MSTRHQRCDERVADCAAPRLERFEERGRDGDDAGRVLEDVFFARIETGELSRRRRRVSLVHPPAFFGKTAATV